MPNKRMAIMKYIDSNEKNLYFFSTGMKYETMKGKNWS